MFFPKDDLWGRCRADPIFFAGRIFDARAINTMSLAFDRVCDQLGLTKTAEDPATKLVAEKIIELTQRGIHDSDLLHAMALNDSVATEFDVTRLSFPFYRRRVERFPVLRPRADAAR